MEKPQSATTRGFVSGDKVRWIATGRIGTVKRQYADGYVALLFEDGQPAELDYSSLKKVETAGFERKAVKRS